MPHKMFVQPYQNGPLGYLIALPKAVYILLKHKFRDARVQFFLVQWAGALLVMLGVGICAFTLMPTLIAAGFFAPMTCFFAFLVWLAAGDMFFKFALEDESFYASRILYHASGTFVIQTACHLRTHRSRSNQGAVWARFCRLHHFRSQRWTSAGLYPAIGASPRFQWPVALTSAAARINEHLGLLSAPSGTLMSSCGQCFAMSTYPSSS
jgi:hypothetical protein